MKSRTLRWLSLWVVCSLLLSATGTALAAPPPPLSEVDELRLIETAPVVVEAGAGYPIPLPRGMAFFEEAEPNDTAATANVLIGTPVVVYATINPATEVDYFAFTATAGDRVYAATMTQFSNGGSTDTVVDVIASDGTTVLESDGDSGSFSSLSSAIGGTIIPADGTYYIRVDGLSGTSIISPYHLHVRVQSGMPTAEVEPNNDMGTATPLGPTGWMSGTITATTDPDLFSFTLNAGDSVYIALDMDPDRATSNTNWNGRVGFGVINNFFLVANDGSTTKPHAEAFFMTVQEAGTYYAYIDSTSATGLGANARYHLSVSVYPKQVQSNCTTFTSTDVPKVLTGTVTSTLVVPVTVTSSISDINATIVLTHNLMADLDVVLTGPTAANTTLFTDAGPTATGGATTMDIGLDDQAALPIGPFTVVQDIIYQPEQPGRLATFNGLPAGGTWTLQLADDTLNTSSGILHSWSLEICGDPPPAYGIELQKTVGVEPGVCASTDAIMVPPGGFDVYYCYTVRNTGLNSLTTHDLVDTELGTIFTDLPYTLVAGATYSHIQQATIYATVVNTGTWTASDGAGNTVSDGDTATVTVRSFCPAGYRDVTVDSTFFGGTFPPAGWTVANTSSGCVAPGVPDWTNTDPGNRTNLTGGVGPFAIADSDRCGSGSTLDAMLSTGMLDFTGLVSPTVSFYTDYNDIATGGDLGLLDVSTDGGATWNNLFTWDADYRGPLLVNQALTGAAGENDAMVRWHYSQGTYDWWWEVDDAFLTACEQLAPSITLTKTVGTEAAACATTNAITVAPGTTVYYCYTVENTGNVTLNLHDLVDDQLGTIFSGLNYALTPGSSVNTVAAGLSIPAVINATTVNTATWSAYNVQEPPVQATSVATVTVEALEPAIVLTKTVGTVPGVCATTDDITVPAGTEVYYCYQAENTGNVTFNFHDLVDSELGVVLDDLPYTLAPGALSPQVIVPETPMFSVTNVATWTAVSSLSGYTVTVDAPYSYIPITTTGTALALSDDGEANITLPFPFTFYGVTSTDVRVGNNGGILFNATTGDVGVTNAALPVATPPLSMLPFWDDIDSDTGDVYWEVQGTAPNRMAIIEWYNRPHYSNTGAATFEVILYEGTNEIKFQYADVDFGSASYDFGASATVGINQNATTALQVSFNQAVIQNGQAILFSLEDVFSASATDSATVTVLRPNIDVNPLSLGSTQAPDTVTNLPLTVANTGEGDLVWTIAEEPVAKAPVILQGGDASVAQEKASSSDFKGSCCPAQAGVAAPRSDWHIDGVVLYDNGPLVTHPGGGAGGADASALQTALGMNTLGSGNQLSAGNRIADDFTVTGGGWFIETVTFFGYQTGSSTTSTFNHLNLRIWNGPPNDAGSAVVFGDTTTNRLASSVWSNIYRAQDTTLTDSTRPIMANEVTVNTFLPAGTYWLDWQAGGTLASGPWAPPVSILGQTSTGNALQYTSTGWAALNDTGTLTPQGMPFIVEGTADCSNPSDVPWLSPSLTGGTNAGGTNTPLTVGLDSTGLAAGTYEARLCVASNDPDFGPGNGTSLVVVPVTLTVTQVLTPSIVLTKTVGTVSGVCATTDDITVPEGTTVYYCYTVANTGDVTLNLHNLVDNPLGTIFSGLNYALTPGSSVNTVAAGLSIPAVMNVTTVNTATWTAYNTGGPSVTATDTARVTVIPSAVSVSGLRASASGGWGSIALLGALALGGFAWRRRRR